MSKAVVSSAAKKILGGLFMKKLISSVLVLVILLSFAIPAMAANDLQTMRASLLLDGGLKYEESTLFHLEKTVPINNHMIECI